MNSDSLGVLVGGASRANLAALTALGTTETLFTMNTDLGTASAFLQIPQGGAVVGSSNSMDPNANPAVLSGNLGRPGQDYRGSRPYFSAASFDGRPFTIQFSGKLTTSNLDATTGHAINIYQATAANGAQLSTKSTVYQALTSATLAAGNYNYLIQLTLIWDSVSQKLQGEGWSTIGGQYASRAGITPITITSTTDLFFFPSVKFNNGAANTVTPVEFSLSAV